MKLQDLLAELRQAKGRLAEEDAAAQIEISTLLERWAARRDAARELRLKVEQLLDAAWAAMQEETGGVPKEAPEAMRNAAQVARELAFSGNAQALAMQQAMHGRGRW